MRRVYYRPPSLGGGGNVWGGAKEVKRAKRVQRAKRVLCAKRVAKIRLGGLGERCKLPQWKKLEAL